MVKSRAQDFHGGLKSQSVSLGEAAGQRADALMKAMGQSCSACHKQFRN